MAEEKQEPLVLPKEFLTCPNCGSSRRFCEEALKDDLPDADAAAGKPMILSGELVLQPKRALFPIKLLAVMDVCVDCGTVYAVELMKFKGALDLPSNGHPPRPPR